MLVHAYCDVFGLHLDNALTVHICRQLCHVVLVTWRLFNFAGEGICFDAKQSLQMHEFLLLRRIGQEADNYVLTFVSVK